MIRRRFLATALLTFASIGLIGFSNASSNDPAQNNNTAAPANAVAIFAGGCFWCMEPPFDKLKGVLKTTSGYIGGHVKNPSYKQVSAGTTGHTEAVEIIYDPAQVSYEKLLHVFWRNIDPLTKDAQFCDHGSQYRSGVFYTNEKQKALAEASKTAIATEAPFKGKSIVTEISQASTFYAAEDYHQDYYQKNPLRYKYYRFRCGRDQLLEKYWGKQK